jgi:5,10-methylenetetrahydrofolate reductase
VKAPAVKDTHDYAVCVKSLLYILDLNGMYLCSHVRQENASPTVQVAVGMDVNVAPPHHTFNLYKRVAAPVMHMVTQYVNKRESISKYCQICIKF